MRPVRPVRVSHTPVRLVQEIAGAIFPYKFRGPAIHYNSTNIDQKVTPLIFLRSLHQDLSNSTKTVVKIGLSSFRKKSFFQVVCQALC